MSSLTFGEMTKWSHLYLQLLFIQPESEKCCMLAVFLGAQQPVRLPCLGPRCLHRDQIENLRSLSINLEVFDGYIKFWNHQEIYSELFYYFKAHFFQISYSGSIISKENNWRLKHKTSFRYYFLKSFKIKTSAVLLYLDLIGIDWQWLCYSSLVY